MREALTVVGFLLILAFAAVFAAPLYVDWNSWRDDISARLSQHFGTSVVIGGTIQARILPQPWLSVGDVVIGDPNGATKLTVGTINGDVSLAGLLRGDINLSNLVIRSPRLTLATGKDGSLQPLSKGLVSADATLESFEIQDGTVRYMDEAAGRDVTFSDIHLVGDSRSLLGPYRAEGGVRFGGVPHTLKLTTGIVADGGLHLRASLVPADRPVTIDLDGEAGIRDGKPRFAGTATLARPVINATGGTGQPDTPWTVSGAVLLTPAALTSDKMTIQLGPDERALKLDGTLEMALGTEPSLEASFRGAQLEIDRFAGVGPQERQAPARVLAQVAEALPDFAGAPPRAHIALSVDGAMLGGELLQNMRADLRASGGRWRVDRLETDLPGRSHLLLAGDVKADAGGFKGSLSLQSRQATGLIGWLQGAVLPPRPNAARQLTLAAELSADANGVDLSNFALAVDEAKVKGRLGWKRLSPDRNAGRIEADLAAERIDLDVLPSMAALLPGRSDIFSEADIRIAAQALAFSGVEAKSVSGRIKAGGKLIALEDVVVNDLDGASLTANGRIDNIGAQPQGEIRVVLDGRDLTGLAAALKRSSLPSFWVNAFASRAASLSPANASLAIAFGASRRYSVDGKFGGSVAQFDAEFGGSGGEESADIRIKADSFDVATLLRQAGLDPAAARIPGRASLDMALSGPLDGAMRWNAGFDGAGVSLSGTGKMTGSFEDPAFDGRLTASTDDAQVPAQLLGIALPGVTPAQSAMVETGFRLRAGRFVFDDLSGTLLGMPVTGALTINTGSPEHVEGKLGFLRADAALLGSLFAGADLGGSNANGNAWADEPFGKSTFDNVEGKLTVTADALRLSRRLPELGRVRAAISFGGGKVNVDRFSASLGSGAVSGALQLSRTIVDTAVTGHFSLRDVAVNTPVLTGMLTTGVDFQGTGASPDALMSSLTGGGTLDLKNPVLTGFSDSAFAETMAAVDGGLKPDAAHIKPAFEQSLAMKPLATSSLSGNLLLAGGVVRLPATLASANGIGLNVSGLLDMSDLTAKANIVLTPPDPKDGLGGPAPTVPVLLSGPLDALQRDVDVSGLTAWLSIRTVERQARKLEALEAERQAQEKAQEDARRAEAQQMQKAIDDARRKAQAQKNSAAPVANPQSSPQPAPPVALPSLDAVPRAPATPGRARSGTPTNGPRAFPPLPPVQPQPSR
ncbi:AsmA family protein [Labrys monachus]|uniref:Uncharacterized protein involved in outer membrane biogenesis n=1 Tax=Labrys monachus TaxID=217067 RepID=A0ABU0FMC0_9HYPH|nr:AsmA family protein [Labrys monachus]MDQ0395238.1 uncharacterized protein involved in outer membrane biogenesis [Labrys monachus]